MYFKWIMSIWIMYAILYGIYKNIIEKKNKKLPFLGLRNCANVELLAKDVLSSNASIRIM